MDLVKTLVDAYLQETEGIFHEYVKPRDYETGRNLFALPPARQVALIHYLMAKIEAHLGGYLEGREDVTFDVYAKLWNVRTVLFARHLPYTEDDLERLLEAVKEEAATGALDCVSSAILRHVIRFQKSRSLSSTMLELLQSSQESLQKRTALRSDMRKVKETIDKLLGTSIPGEPDPGEAWADTARADLAAMNPKLRQVWATIITHAASASAGTPNKVWLKEAQKNQQALGDSEFIQHTVSWLMQAGLPPPFLEVEPPTPQEDAPNYAEDQCALEAYYQRWHEYYQKHFRFSDKNMAILKGLAWYSSSLSDVEIVRALVHLVEAGYESVPGYGAWAKSAGNAAIWSLGQMPGAVGVGPLARLRTRLRDRSALKLIAAAIESAAQSAGMSVDDLEDLAVPTGGLDADGTRRETFGEDGAALLTLDAKNAKTNCQWFGPDGQPRKAVPKNVKTNSPAEVKALKAAETEIGQAVSAQAARLDRALLDERTWTLGVWRERYLGHPVLGNLARRLIWVVNSIASLPQDLPGDLPDDAEVRLWHPLGETPAEVLRWRQMLESRAVVQPFKQAHREVYLLTDAERQTRTYSNRFAAHVLKQHQFNSLCVLRGWKNQLRLMVDDEYPPAVRELPRWNLRAEFWVEGIGDDYGTDTNEAGTYLRLVTDQVRFYPLAAPGQRQDFVEIMPLEEVPPLAFSEIMRDVDLFVGVASVGNDPTWADGGPQGRYADYWQSYAFGDLTETAKTRAAVLARLLPRLKIADRCRLDGKFLVVQGDLRTYKIHLGSGNILMAPNDQYLCIVPNSREGDSGDLFLPFEGDRILAVVLSKAFLLAADRKIADPTITRQIQR